MQDPPRKITSITKIISAEWPTPYELTHHHASYKSTYVVIKQYSCRRPRGRGIHTSME